MRARISTQKTGKWITGNIEITACTPTTNRRHKTVRVALRDSQGATQALAELKDNSVIQFINEIADAYETHPAKEMEGNHDALTKRINKKYSQLQVISLLRKTVSKNHKHHTYVASIPNEVDTEVATELLLKFATETLRAKYTEEEQHALFDTFNHRILND